MSLVAGSKLGPYEILALIGAGGMGEVYRALDTRLNRPVAVKLLSDELADATARRRFQREAQMASSLNHPHILTIHDVGEIEDRQYLVTEYIDGGTLKDWSRPPGQRTWREIVELLVGVADGLGAAHAAGILHRDIKPANILITKSGYAKLADFGLAKLVEDPNLDEATWTLTDKRTRRGVVIGTVAYMSPEQAAGKPLDARSDIFSFGVVLYQMLEGRRPFEGVTELETLQTIIHGTPQPLTKDVPVALRAVVEKALEKDSADRYQAMREMVVDLRRLTRQSADTVVPPATRPMRRIRPAATVALMVLLAALIALIVFQSRSPGPSDRTQYTQLTNFDSAIDPALSPDGRMMAFVRGTGPAVQSTGDPTEIYIKLLPDGDPVQLTHDGLPYKGSPRFSPDGARIAYYTLETTGFYTWVVPVLGGQGPRRFLTNAMGLNWINEGNQPRILFSYMTGKGVTMAVASSTESRSDQRTVYTEDGIMNHLSFLSPDGKQLLMNAMEPYGRWEACRLAPYDGSSKGKKVGPQPGQCAGAAWSPDGKWMYFTADTGSGKHIWRQRFPDGTPEQVTFGTTEEEGIAVAPDGRSLLTSIGTYQNKIWIHDSRGDRQVTSDSYSFLPTFSSDGKKLYHVVRTAGGLITPYGGLWVTDLESGQRQRLLPEFQMWFYSVSRDGKRVAFGAPKEAGHPGMWLAVLDGSAAPRQLTASEGLAAYFGAGSDVFYDAQEREGTFVYRAKDDGSDIRKVIPQAVYSLNGVSPDGKYLAISVYTEVGGGTGATMLYPADGGSPKMICVCGNRAPDAPQPVSWSPDGKLFYISLVGGQAVYSVPLRPGHVLPPLPPGGIRSSEDATKLPGAKLLPVSGAFPAPDPSVYAYPKFTAQRNIHRVPLP